MNSDKTKRIVRCTHGETKRGREREIEAAGQRNRIDGGYCYVLQYSFFFRRFFSYFLLNLPMRQHAMNAKKEKTPNKARSTLLHHIKCNKVGNHQSCARMARVYIIYVEWCVSLKRHLQTIRDLRLFFVYFDFCY